MLKAVNDMQDDVHHQFALHQDQQRATRHGISFALEREILTHNTSDDQTGDNQFWFAINSNDVQYFALKLQVRSDIWIGRAARDPHFHIQFTSPTHLVCNDHLTANIPSFHMNLAVAMKCCKGIVLHSFEISMIWFFKNFISYTPPTIYCCYGTKLYTTI